MNWLVNGDTIAPQVALSAQMVINCEAGGTCSGGEPLDVYQWAHTHGLGHETCEQYIAHDIDEKKEICSDFNVCMDCVGPIPKEGEHLWENCWAIENYKQYWASGYRFLQGAEEMKKELSLYGPIGCAIEVNDDFSDNYKSGIYSKEDKEWDLNHEISVVGYGTDEEGTEYWIGRNSWGTYWGEMGYFKVLMHKNNMGIETNCQAAYASYEKPKASMQTE
jgi:cathepsin X